MSGMGKRLLWCYLLVGYGNLLSGCAQISIYGKQEVSVTNHIGFVRIDVTPKSAPVYLDSAGYGLILGSGSITFGFRNEEKAIFPNPNQCAILIVASSPQDVKLIDKVLKQEGDSLANVCITGRSKSAQQ